MRIGNSFQAASITGAAILLLTVLASAADITYNTNAMTPRSPQTETAITTAAIITPTSDTQTGGTTVREVVDSPAIPEFTAVPEPMTLSLVGAALIGLGLWGRRKVRP
jgi:hypothetical protein